MAYHSPHHCSKVELFLSAQNLKDKDTFSKSDPFAVLYTESSPGNFAEHGRTEIKRNDLNPQWSTSFTLDFYFQLRQPLKFQILDYDESKSDDLGCVLTSLGDLVGKGISVIALPHGGELRVRVEQINFSREAFVFSFRGIHLDKKDTFGKSDPYFHFYKLAKHNEWLELYKSEIIKDTLDPVWAPFELKEQAICNGDRNRPIRIVVYDWDRNSDPELIGIHETNLNHLLTPGYKMVLKYPGKQNPTGELEITEIVVKRYLSFIDYLWAGVQLSLSAAIDFTASNKDPEDPTSLHHLSENSWNDYQKAIWEVGEILQAYDTDHLYPVFGYGGCPRKGEVTSHCFPLNGEMHNPYVRGIEGVLQAYYATLKVVELSGPTYFHHIIDQTIAVAQKTPPNSQYYILLILTDGAIMDMQETIDSVVKASSLPISIVIVGIGSAEFDSMVTLDADKGLLVNSHGQKAVRDIVQFVPFRKFDGNPVLLASEVLKEVPGQFTEFMRYINYVPEAEVIRVNRERNAENIVNAESGHRHHHHHHHHGAEEHKTDIAHST